jgi:hypothetical protein
MVVFHIRYVEIRGSLLGEGNRRLRDRNQRKTKRKGDSEIRLSSQENLETEEIVSAALFAGVLLAVVS